MVKKKAFHILWLLLPVLLFAMPVLAAKNKPAHNIVLTLPADTILNSLQKILPLDIPSQSRQLQGDIIVESLNALAIADDAITVRGVLSGRNLVVLTQLAGQDIQLRLGEVHLPVTCILHTRFDSVRRKLYVTPRFADTTAGGDDLAPLLGSLAGREYQVDLDALETMHIRVGNRSIPMTMEPVRIAAVNNALELHMLPQVGTPR